MAAIRVYGSKVSYFTGKLEAYLRYKGLEYVHLPLTPNADKVFAAVGTTQYPAVELEDGRWMSDTTPIIRFFESRYPAPSVVPEDPLLRFVALLIEDYADEWLWRSAMHYRWSYPQGRDLLSGVLADEVLIHVRLPRWVRKRMIIRRQHRGFVLGDGVSDATWDHVEAGYRTALDNMTRMLETRPFLLGDAPSIADFGMMGPMLRHFGQDPTPAELMREKAPSVYEWVARVWNAHGAKTPPKWLDSIPEDAHPMLQEIAETHMSQLAQNVEAYARGEKRYQAIFQGVAYANLPVSRYRVWCLEELRREFSELSADVQDRLRTTLGEIGSAPLDATTLAAPSGYDEAREAPFNRAINVYADGVPE